MEKKRRLQRELDKLKERLLLLGSRVEENVRLAVSALGAGDLLAAKRLIESDAEIDQIEVDLEEECLKVLALHQPVAVDLRFIVAVLKINNDLERVGDMAVKIAEHTLTIAGASKVRIPFDFEAMADKAQGMLRRSLDAFVQWSAALAAAVREEDDEVDEANRQMYRLVEAAIRATPENLVPLISTMGLSRSLERIADLAVAIAEEVIYLVEGEIVRHKAP